MNEKPEPASILIIEDEPQLARLMLRALTRAGYVVHTAPDMSQGKILLEKEKIDLVFLDIQLPDGNGIRFLPHIRMRPLPPEVIVMTAYANPDTVDAALKEGAWLYIEKPFDLTYVITAASQALKYHRQKQQCPIPSSGHIQLVGNSGRMKLLKQKVALAAGSDVPILIVGETGTGKELVSQVIHSTGIRSQNPFVTLDCTVLQETLVESELFGHKKGSFTSATTDYDGLILQARGGTLFIDEIGELNLSLQKKFLRVLQNRSYRPVGANRDIESDFRMIAATN